MKIQRATRAHFSVASRAPSELMARVCLFSRFATFVTHIRVRRLFSDVPAAAAAAFEIVRPRKTQEKAAKQGKAMYTATQQRKRVKIYEFGAWQQADADCR